MTDKNLGGLTMTITDNVDVPFLLRAVRVEEAYCEKHGAYERSINGIGIASSCPVCVEERDREVAAKKEAAFREQEREDREWLTRFCRVSPEHYPATLENYLPRNETQRRALDLVRALVSEYQERGRGYAPLKHGKLIISGHNGLGKTHLGVAAVKALRGQIWTMYEISAHIRATYSKKSKETEMDIIERFTRLPLLVIDEIGHSSGKAAERNWLSIIVDKRHSWGLPIMLLSDKPFRDESAGGLCVEHFMDTDAISRFRDGGAKITLTGDDYRVVLGNQKRDS
jgi:DNA replication protein DnaC